MRCLICDTTYETLSWSGPSEPCDCGACFSRADWRDPANEGFDLDAARKEWRASQLPGQTGATITTSGWSKS